MHLTRLSIGGWRSFSPDAPFTMEDLGRVNVLMGPNGVGKSNLGRFAHWLMQILAKASQVQGYPLYTIPAALHTAYDPADSWGLLGGPLVARLGVDATTLPPALECPFAWLGSDGRTLELRWSAEQQGGGEWWGSLQPYTAEDKPFFRFGDESGSRPDVLDANGRYRPVKDESLAGIHGFALGLCSLLPRRWLHVPALRHPEAQGSLGATVRARLVDLFQNHKDPLRWASVRGRLEAWLGRLLGERVVVDVPGADVRVTRTGTGMHLPVLLRDAGDGVAQYVYLLTALLLHPEEPALVFMDEPEAHLHPGALLELLRIIDQDLPHVQLIAATHSSAVVDALSPEWHFWRVLRDTRGASRAERIETQAARIGALDALGVSASQIFMARTVVWVEGPSDVVYYRRLLADADPDLVLGRDYAFAIFGGSNAEHFSLDGANELGDAVVDVLRLAHRNIFIHDMDSSDAARRRVDVWRKQIESQRVNGLALTTPGREVENLVAPDGLLGAAKASVTFVREKRTKVPVCFDGPLRLGPDESFVDALAARARRDPRGKLTADLRARVADQIRAKKHRVAREVMAWCAENGAEVFTPAAKAWAKGVVDKIRA